MRDEDKGAPTHEVAFETVVIEVMCGMGIDCLSNRISKT